MPSCHARDDNDCEHESCKDCPRCWDDDDFVEPTVNTSVCACCEDILATSQSVFVINGVLCCSQECAMDEYMKMFMPDEVNPADIGEYGCIDCGRIFESEDCLERTDRGNVCNVCRGEAL